MKCTEQDIKGTRKRKIGGFACVTGLSLHQQSKASKSSHQPIQMCVRVDVRARVCVCA